MTEMCLSILAFAAALTVPQMPVSPYADTEVSTNVAFNVERSDARSFGVSMAFSGTESNCVQIAFGRDTDHDGNLSAKETRLLLGWRGGSYFIEDAIGQNRLVEPAVGAVPTERRFVLNAKLNAHSVPVVVSVSNECGACFVGLSENAPDWLYMGRTGI